MEGPNPREAAEEGDGGKGVEVAPSAKSEPFDKVERVEFSAASSYLRQIPSRWRRKPPDAPESANVVAR